LAATLLLALGLSGWAGLSSGPALAVPVLEVAVKRSPFEADFATGAQERAMMKGPDALTAPAPGPKPETTQFVLNLGDRTPAEYRAALRAAAGTDRLPPPPAVERVLELRNDGNRPLRIDLDDERAELTLDLDGPGVVRVVAPRANPPLAGAKAVCLAPGDAFPLPIRRLIEGARGAVRYQYWTEPGDYTLTVRLRAPVESDPVLGPRMQTFVGKPIPLRVEARP
jgi:hypothetical protein